MLLKQEPKNRFLLGFTTIVLVLSLIRLVFPQVAGSQEHLAADGEQRIVQYETITKPHRILGVSNYRTVFPDSNSVQLIAANQWGVRPVKDRKNAESRKKELVYMGVSPYYHVDPMHSSIPYLVPRAALLLQDIGQAFYDSLYVKGIPMQQIIVTSVLRTMDDVANLRRHNGNATENSCHLYGTTFDICYNRYFPVDGSVRNDTLKWILSEVLRDKREEGRCYIKYEVKQGCFHMTVR